MARLIVRLFGRSAIQLRQDIASATWVEDCVRIPPPPHIIPCFFSSQGIVIFVQSALYHVFHSLWGPAC